MANLVCLCRRHHRIKQRPGWHTTLSPDGTMTWTDPTATVRTTTAVDALHPTVLPDTTTPGSPQHSTGDGPPRHTTVHGTHPDRAAPDGAAPADAASTGTPSQARVVLSDAPHSDLEFTHEHRTAALPWTPTGWHDQRGHHRIELTPTTHHLLLNHPPDHRCPAHRTHREHRPGRPTDHDPPPF
jgi:hypothetical protein